MPSALITGSNRNLGLAFVRHYARAGWRVFATCRDLANAGALEELAGAANGRLTVHRMDVTDIESIRVLANELRGQPIDVLVNNASIPGTHRGASFGETDYSEWDAIMRTNAFGPFMVAEAFFEHVASSDHKTIAAISSRIGAKPSYFMVPYRISKAALNQVVGQIAIAAEPRGVVCVALHPGWVQNDVSGTRAILTPDESVAMLAKVIGGLTIEDSGKFFEPDGSELPLVTRQFEDKPYSMPPGGHAPLT